MTTTYSDVIVPEVFAEAIEAALAGKNCLEGTDIVAMDSSLKCARTDAGLTVKVPYIDAMAEAEEVAANAAAQLNGITEYTESNTIRRIAIGVETEKLAELAALNDPYETGSRQAAASIIRKFDSILISAATSATLPAYTKADGTVVSAGTWSLIHDAYTGTPVTVNPDLITEARFLFEDEQAGDFAGYVMHSKVAKDLLLLKDSTGRGLYQEAGENGLPSLLGSPIVMSSKMTKSADATPKYTTCLFKKKSMAAWYKARPEVLFETDSRRNTEIMVIWMYVVIHRYRVMPGCSKPGVALLLTK